MNSCGINMPGAWLPLCRENSRCLLLLSVISCQPVGTKNDEFMFFW